MEELHCGKCGHTIEVSYADIESSSKEYRGTCKRCNTITIIIEEEQQEPQQKCEQCGSTNLHIIHAGNTIFKIICKDCSNE